MSEPVAWRQLAEAFADAAVYPDSFGVQGSEFSGCRLCFSESGAGKYARENWHKEDCPMVEYERLAAPPAGNAAPERVTRNCISIPSLAPMANVTAPAPDVAALIARLRLHGSALSQVTATALQSQAERGNIYLRMYEAAYARAETAEARVTELQTRNNTQIATLIQVTEKLQTAEARVQELEHAAADALQWNDDASRSRLRAAIAARKP